MNRPDSVRASDDDRDDAVKRLRTAAAAGLLTPEELSARIVAVRGAKTRGELAGVTADLPAMPAGQASRRRWIVSVFGDITRAGSWPPGRKVSPIAVFGDIDLDLRQAAMPPGEVAITAVAPFGNIEVLVPDGAEVDVGGFTLFGSKKIAVGDAPPNVPSPVIRVRGFTLFGSVKVWSA